jgi:prepilin-type N-terminal cleavage/methylation domain-containing protein
MTRRGFTFVELLVALVLMGIVSTSIYQLLNNNQKVYRRQGQQIDLNQNVRAAVNILPAEIRELDTGDPAGSDIVAMDSTSLTYNAMRNFYFLCLNPNTAGLTVTLGTATWYGSTALDVGSQQFLLFAENDPTSRRDDTWLHVNSTVRANGTACAGAGASAALTLTGVTAAQLSGVTTGAPIRGYTTVKVSQYQDANGAYWIGSQTQDKATGNWTTVQPIVGPIASNGLAFRYYNAAGAVTADRTQVARIAVTIRGQTSDPIRSPGGSPVYGRDSMTTQIALRNNRRW